MDYYTNMIGVVCDQQVFLAVLAQIHPEIAAKFDSVGLDPSVLSIEWFVCLFTSSLPFYVIYFLTKLVKIVWDRLLVEGPRAFIKAGVIIMDHFKEQILEVSEFRKIALIQTRLYFCWRRARSSSILRRQTSTPDFKRYISVEKD